MCVCVCVCGWGVKCVCVERDCVRDCVCECNSSHVYTGRRFRVLSQLIFAKMISYKKSSNTHTHTHTYRYGGLGGHLKFSVNYAQYRPTRTPLSRGARAIINISKMSILFTKIHFLIFQKIATHRFTQTFWWYTGTHSPYTLVRT